MRFFRVCRERPDKLSEALALTPWSREELAYCRELDQLDDVEFARRFAVTCWMTPGSRQNSKSWRHTIGANKGGGRTTQGPGANCPPLSPRLPSACGTRRSSAARRWTC